MSASLDALPLPAALPCWVKAIFSWTAEDKTKDLGFIEGDLIQVLNTGDGLWWTGKLRRNNVVGSFPCNFVAYINPSDSSQPLPTDQATSANTSSTSINNIANSKNNTDINNSNNNYNSSQSISRTSSFNSISSYQFSPAGLPPVPPQHQQTFQQGFYHDDRYARPIHDHLYTNTTYYSNNNINNSNSDNITNLSNFANNRNNNGSAFSLASNDYIHQQGPPPIPPPHSVPLKPLSAPLASPSAETANSIESSNSNRSSGIGVNRNGSSNTGSAIPRTPSPLRNAMDDVMYSLHTLELATSPAKDQHRAQFGRADSTASLRSSDVRGPPVAATTPLPLSSAASIRRSPERDSGIMPFSSSSFGSSPLTADSRSPERRKDLHSLNVAGVDMKRGGSRISFSDSLNQGLIDDRKLGLNDSLISGASSDDDYFDGDHGTKSKSKTRNGIFSGENQYAMSSSTGFSSSIAYEQPVDLPQNNVSGTKSIRKQFGVIKKFFANNMNANSVRMGTTMTAAPRHERANSAVVISNSMREYRGRSALSSLDLYQNGGLAEVFGDNSSHEDQERWIEINRALHRTKTLTSSEIEERIKRAKQQLGGALAQRALEPVEALKQAVGNETGDGGFVKKDTLRLARYDFGEVDIEVFSASWDVFAQYRTMVDFVHGFFKRRWRDPIDQLRAAFNFCAAKLKWEPLFDDDDEDDDDVRKSFTRIMQTRRASCLDVALFFQEICSELEIPCEIVPGYLKGPGEVWYDETALKPNHYWNGVIVDGVWRMVDTSLANPSFPTHHLYAASVSRKSAPTTSSGADIGTGGLLTSTARNSLPEHFYFLTKPNEFVFTHTPTFNNLDATHIIPNPRSEILLALPLKSPVAFQHGVSLLDFNTALARIVDGRDYVAELLVKVRNPHVYLVARVKPGNFPIGSACSTSYHSFDDDDDDDVIGGGSGMAGRSDAGSGQNALAQPFWSRKHDRLFYRIKAVLPRPYRQGALNIYVGFKPQGSGAPPRRRAGSDDLVLALSVPITSVPDDESYGFNPRKLDRFPKQGATGERECEMDRPVQFLQRYPLRYDIYIHGPQCFNLIYGHGYVFKVQYYNTLAFSSESGNGSSGRSGSSGPAGAISRSLSGGGSTQKIKMALQTPRGRVIKMARAQDAEDTWQLQHCVLDIGIWRALVLNASTDSNWSVYAEWYCES